MNELTITVHGTPGPQGSKKLVGRDGKGRGILVESSKKVKPWREAVKWAALMATKGRPDSDPGITTGPISVDVIFTMQRPKSAKNGDMPSKRYDIDKLLRSTFDALTEIGAWEDDARVVQCMSMKVFPGQHPDALHVPGAVIRIRKAV